MQNDITELYAILELIKAKGLTNNADVFYDEYNDNQEKLKADYVDKYVLRRLTKDHLNIPPMRVVILNVDLTKEQRDVYSLALKNKNNYLVSQFTNSGNIYQELRKICCHPAIDDPSKTVISGCKMILLDKLLARLKEEGHRVIIFTQLTSVVYLLKMYCDQRRYNYASLSAGSKDEDRQHQIDKFQNEDIFLFLATSRVGSLGVNLTAADTVILFDCDTNPQRDLQAIARCRRIGQTKPVTTYIFLCNNTIEKTRFDSSCSKLEVFEKILQPGVKTPIRPQDDISDQTLVDDDIDTIINAAPQAQLSESANLESGADVLNYSTCLDDINWDGSTDVTLYENLKKQEISVETVTELAQNINFSSNNPVDIEDAVLLFTLLDKIVLAMIDREIPLLNDIMTLLSQQINESTSQAKVSFIDKYNKIKSRLDRKRRPEANIKKKKVQISTPKKAIKVNSGERVIRSYSDSEDSEYEPHESGVSDTEPESDMDEDPTSNLEEDIKESRRSSKSLSKKSAGNENNNQFIKRSSPRTKAQPQVPSVSNVDEDSSDEEEEICVFFDIGTEIEHNTIASIRVKTEHQE
ncbi:hypothetical protein AKO1_007399 [Acrasis kona]|uniref:Helicase C-terminal domain-containing protein n=1 Tax=Acrasis kona TaxID=1008807 RepID=A0AAW2YR82_9EUKA